MSFLSNPIDMYDSFMHPEQGYNKAMQQMQQYWQEALKYMSPYAEGGNSQLSRLTGAEDLLLDPSALQAKWSQGYSTSPEAMDLLNRSTELGQQQASSMGLAGSSANLENIQRTGSSIVSQDRQKYMDDLMKKYMLGIGIGQDIYGTGAGMAASMGQGALGMGRDMGGLAYGRQAAPGERLGQMAGMAASMFGGGAGGAGGAATLR